MRRRMWGFKRAAYSDTTELRNLMDYGNRFHHDTNPAWQTEIINDQELEGFIRRVLAFMRRR